MSIRIVIADDHAVVRAGLTAFISLSKDIEVVGEAANGKKAVALIEKLHPDVVIMDLMMPVMDGIAATKEIVSKQPQVKVLVLTTYEFSQDVKRALDAGASGAIIKTASNTSLLATIRNVAAGKHIISPEIQLVATAQTEEESQLTPRQLDILHSVTRGLTNQDIATQFGITIDGVKFHIRTICDKIGAANRAEAVAIALRKHLLKI